MNEKLYSAIDIEALIESYKKTSENATCPDDLFVPGYGWVIRNGVGTEEGKRWYDEVLSKYDKKSN